MKSLSRFITTALLAVVVSASALGAPTPPDTFNDKEALGVWLTRFYQAPEPTLVPAAILSASKLGMFQGQARSFAYFGFLAGVMSKYPDQASDIANQLVALPPAEQPALVTGLWYSTFPGKADLLKSLAGSMPVYKDTILYLAGNESKPVFTLPVEDGTWVLDVLWGYYMATGDEQAVVRIADALHWLGDTDQEKAKVAAAAKWSLTAQGKLQPTVLSIVKFQTQAPKRDPKIRAALREIGQDTLKK